jgi:hypothetical protein
MMMVMIRMSRSTILTNHPISGRGACQYLVVLVAGVVEDERSKKHCVFFPFNFLLRTDGIEEKE